MHKVVLDADQAPKAVSLTGGVCPKSTDTFRDDTINRPRELGFQPDQGQVSLIFPDKGSARMSQSVGDKPLLSDRNGSCIEGLLSNRELQSGISSPETQNCMTQDIAKTTDSFNDMYIERPNVSVAGDTIARQPKMKSDRGHKNSARQSPKPMNFTEWQPSFEEVGKIYSIRPRGVEDYKNNDEPSNTPKLNEISAMKRTKSRHRRLSPRSSRDKPMYSVVSSIEYEDKFKIAGLKSASRSVMSDIPRASSRSGGSSRRRRKPKQKPPVESLSSDTYSPRISKDSLNTPSRNHDSYSIREKSYNPVHDSNPQSQAGDMMVMVNSVVVAPVEHKIQSKSYSMKSETAALDSAIHSDSAAIHAYLVKNTQNVSKSKTKRRKSGRRGEPIKGDLLILTSRDPENDSLPMIPFKMNLDRSTAISTITALHQKKIATLSYNRNQLKVSLPELNPTTRRIVGSTKTVPSRYKDIHPYFPSDTALEATAPPKPSNKRERLNRHRTMIAKKTFLDFID